MLIGVKALGRHQLDFSMFSEIYRHCLHQEGLTVSLWIATDNFGNSLYCLAIKPLWPTTRLDVTHSWY